MFKIAEIFAAVNIAKPIQFIANHGWLIGKI